MLQFCILRGCLEKRQAEELPLKMVLGRNAGAGGGWCFSRSRVDCILILFDCCREVADVTVFILQ